MGINYAEISFWFQRIFRVACFVITLPSIMLSIVIYLLMAIFAPGNLMGRFEERKRSSELPKLFNVTDFGRGIRFGFDKLVFVLLFCLTFVTGRIESIFLLNLILVPYLSFMFRPGVELVSVPRYLVIWVTLLSVSISQYAQLGFGLVAIRRITVGANIGGQIAWIALVLGCYMAFILIGGIGAWIFSPGIEWLLSQWWSSYFGIAIVAIYVGVVGLSVLWTVAHDWRTVRAISINDVRSREAISRMLLRIRTNYWRQLLVNRIGALHKEEGTKPVGEWPDDKLPGAYGEPSFTALARMDEKWRGLDR
jgi:hypothetical protein